jgi:exoribonuclease II
MLASIEIRERRRRDRRGESIPDFMYVVVNLKDDSQKEKTFKLEVLDRSEFGVGILVRNEDAEILERIEVGDKLRDITLYGSYTIMKVQGTVMHKTKRDVDGDEFHVVGIEFEETLEQLSSFGKR